MWVLVAILLDGSGQPTAIEMMDFNSQDSCNVAQREIASEMGKTNWRSLCLPK